METSKWNLPGWRIEQRYNNRVLIGNWNEERRQVNPTYKCEEEIFVSHNLKAYDYRIVLNNNHMLFLLAVQITSRL